MVICFKSSGPRLAVRLACAAAAAALLAGCSSDVSRFNDPFSNPFQSASSHSDGTPTGSITAQSASLSYPKSTPIESQPLSAPVAAYEAPAHASPSGAPILPTRTVVSSAPAARAPIASATAGRWSPEGGAPVVVGRGETAAVLATRYGVPTDVLLHVNGFTSAAQIQPGTRLVIPVYNAGGVATASPAAAPVAARVQAKAAAPVVHFVRGPAAANAPRQASVEPQQPAAKLARLPAAKTEPVQIATTKDLKTKGAKTNVAAVTVPTTTHVAGAAPAARQPAPHVAALAPGAARTAKNGAPVGSQPQVQTLVAEAPVMPAVQPKAQPLVAVDPAPTGSLPPSAEPAAAPGPGFRWPAHGRIIEGFKTGGNDGINIALPEGTSIKAADDGVVAYAGSELKGYGNLVLIRHPNGFVTAYADNQEIEVKRGDVVKRGQVIAKSGQTGNVTSPQLHFELRKGATPVDPTNFLAAL